MITRGCTARSDGHDPLVMRVSKEAILNRKAFIFWRLLFSTTVQGMGAPFIDRAFTQSREGKRYRSIAILLTPWKRNRYGESQIQKALVIGWQQ